MFELTVFYDNGDIDVLRGFGPDGVDQAVADIEGDPEVNSVAVKWIEED
jgi:hypothetical protein